MTRFNPGAAKLLCERCNMKDDVNDLKSSVNRRSFVKGGLTAAGAATVGTGLITHSSSLLAEDRDEDHRGRLARGDAALLRFAAAAEILEADFWIQYNELGGVQD